MVISVTSRFWSLKVPLHWSMRNEDDCITFSGEPDLGGLQISGREKECAVNDDDLRGFATDRANPDSKLEPVAIGTLVGFTTESVQDDILWREWWLRQGCIMVYLTYNVEVTSAGVEDSMLEEILESLRLRPDHPAVGCADVFSSF